MGRRVLSVMDELSIPSFAMWSIVTGIMMLVTGFSYRAYRRVGRSEIAPS